MHAAGPPETSLTVGSVWAVLVKKGADCFPQDSWATIFNCKEGIHVGHLVLAPGRLLYGTVGNFWPLIDLLHLILQALVLPSSGAFSQPTQFSSPCSPLTQMVLDCHETMFQCSPSLPYKLPAHRLLTSLQWTQTSSSIF